MHRYLERMVLLGVLGTMAALGIWLQVSLLEPPVVKPALSSTHEPDYIIQSFTATGRDEAGVIYVLKAQRLVHFPDDNTSLLDAPRLVQYQDDQPLRHTTSESGWLSGDGKDVLLTGNVKVTQNPSEGDPGSVTRTERLTVRLERGG